MKLYLVYSQEIPKSIPRILLSYFAIRKKNLELFLQEHFVEPYPEKFLDSGAYSAYTQKKKLDIDEYCTYVTMFQKYLTTYSNLDVIGDAESTWRNQSYMERKKLSPLPVFHVGEDWKYLERYVSHYSYMALGGMVSHLRVESQRHKELMRWIIKCFRVAGSKTVFHGYGCTRWEMVKSFPWYSIDSSSWFMGVRYGDLMIFDRRSGKFVTVNLGNKNCNRYASVFRDLGYNSNDFAQRSKNDKMNIGAVSAKSFVEAEHWIEQFRGPIAIPEQKGSCS